MYEVRKVSKVSKVRKKEAFGLDNKSRNQMSQRNFLKRRMIEALKNEILEFLPKRMKSKKKRELVDV